MAEEIEIVVSQKATGTALKDAIADQEKLRAGQEKLRAEAAAEHPAPRFHDGTAPVPPHKERRLSRLTAGGEATGSGQADRTIGRSMAAATVTPKERAKAQRDARAVELRATRESLREDRDALEATKLDAARAHAAGNTADGARLEREAEIQRRAIVLRKTMGAPRDKALSMATEAVEGGEAKTEDARRRAEAVRQAKADEVKGAKEAAEAARQQRQAERQQVQAGREADEARELNHRRQVFGLEQQAGLRRMGGDDKGADALEREARVLQLGHRLKRELKVSDQEALHLANQRVVAEEAIVKARGGGLGQAGRVALNVGGRAADASGMGGIASMIGAAGPEAIAVAAVAALGGAYASQWRDRKDERERQRGEGILQANRSDYISHLTGGEGQERAGADAERLRAEVEELKERKGSFTQSGWGDMARNGYNNTLGRVLPTLDTSDVKAERENDETLARKEGELKKAQAAAGEAFKSGPGQWDLDARRKVLDGDIKGAIALRDRAAAERDYQSVLKQNGHDEAGAMEAAELSVREAARGRAQSLGHLVNARSGAGDISRLAGLAAAESTGSASVQSIVASLQQIHGTMQSQGAQALAWKPHKI